MKKLILFIFVVIIVSCETSSSKQPVSEEFKIFRGTNIAHWLSQSGKRGVDRKQFFTRQDIENIAHMGFDHIRLPIDEEQMWDENGNRHKDAFELMENCIDWCSEFNLRIIIDLHILRSHHFNAEEKPLWTDPAEQEKFYDMWRNLSKSLSKYPNGLVAYELMNEAVADDHNDWNKLIGNAITAIRKLEPNRTIVVGSNRWQSVNTFNELIVPANDPNILLSFHFYEPFLLTHYHASWTHLKDYEGLVHYPGILLTEEEYNELPENMKPIVKGSVNKEFNKAVILEMWQKPINKAKELGLPLYCGEFGVITGTPQNDRLEWYRDLIALFEENGIGYANWNYRSGSFGLLDKDQRNEELIRIVSGKK